MIKTLPEVVSTTDSCGCLLEEVQAFHLFFSWGKMVGLTKLKVQYCWISKGKEVNVGFLYLPFPTTA